MSDSNNPAFSSQPSDASDQDAKASPKLPSVTERRVLQVPDHSSPPTEEPGVQKNEGEEVKNMPAPTEDKGLSVTPIDPLPSAPQSEKKEDAKEFVASLTHLTKKTPEQIEQEKLVSPKTDTKKKKGPLITLEMVSKTFGEDPLDYKTLVLKNVYLEIEEGEFLIVFGPSGSGKSSLLNLVAGLEAPTGGRVLVRKRDLTKFDSEELALYHRKRMGMVFQNFNLIKSLNVWENVALPQTASGIGYAARKKRAMRLLKLLHIDHYANRHPNEISGGEQQRVAIARALINSPAFLLVDEPTGNLDSKSAEGVMTLLYELNAHSNHTIILVTHNPNHLKYATRVIYIEDGKVVIEENRDRETEMPKPDPTFEHKGLAEYKGDHE